MVRWFRVAALLGLLSGVAMPAQAQAPTSGGTLRIYHRENPASASIHEETSIATVMPFMPVFNNLVVFNQHGERNDVADLTAELATDWSWNADNTRLTFRLRDGVKWHDGQPFTAADVKCTWDGITGRRQTGWRKNPRRDWYFNLQEVTTNGDHEVSFQLGRPQPSFLAFLASGFSPVYPCHVDARVMRQKPIGTGPFRVVDFRPNASITLERNPNYWRPGLPYLDGINFRIIRSRSTRILAFVAGEFDMTFSSDISVPLMRDVKSQAPQAQCRMNFSNVSDQVLINHEAAPFDQPAVRRAVSLAIDRQAFIDILGEGENRMGGAMLTPPAGLWGLTREQLVDAGIDGYGDVAAAREEARRIMRAAGYSAERPLRLKLATRDIPSYRDPAVILIDHLKTIFIEAELQILDTGVWYTTLLRPAAWTLAMNQSGAAIDDPDVILYENYLCGSERNYPRYCNRPLQDRFEAQSRMTDPVARRQAVQEIDLQLQRDAARPIILHSVGGTCWHPQVRNITPAANSIYNHWRMEDAWLAR